VRLRLRLRLLRLLLLRLRLLLLRLLLLRALLLRISGGQPSLLWRHALR
jgi:hypothetical protein